MQVDGTDQDDQVHLPEAGRGALLSF